MTRKVFTPRPYQEIITQYIMDTPRCAIWAGMGMGKQQPNSEPVLTPAGWAVIGDVRVGDLVIGSDGNPTRVTGVFPQGVKPVYRITLNDRSWTRAGPDHLWSVQTPRRKFAGRPSTVLTTQQLLNAGLTDNRGNRKWFLPIVEPVQHEEKEFLLDPYTLGVILGDGTICSKGSTGICTDKSIIDSTGARWLRDHSTCDYVAYGSFPGARATMCALGLNGKRSWEKHVPEEYLFGSPAQRLALLQGLLDTDGYAMRDGGVEFSSTSEMLIDAVVQLAQSLGGTGRKSAKRITRFQGGDGRPSWRVNVKLSADMAPFRLARKLAAWVAPTKYPVARGIHSIEYEGEESSTCISVAALDALYVTQDYILTHNSSATLTAIDNLRMCGETDPVLILAPLRVAQSSWPDEVRKWDVFKNLSIMPILGSEAERKAALRYDADIFTTNFENIPWLIEYYGDRWPFKTVVADESTRLKSLRLSFRTSTTGKEYLAGQGGKRAKELGKIAHTKIRRFIELTGTPAPNGLHDLWGQIWFCDRGHRLGRTYEGFKQRWFRPKRDGYGIEPTDFAQEQIQDKLRDICLTIDAKDWFDLKDPIVTPVYVDLPPKARLLYDEMEKNLFMELDGHEVEAFNSAVKTQKLLQIASGACYVDPLVDSDENPKSKEWKDIHDQKLLALEEIIEEAAGMPVLVAYHFRSDLARILKKFKQARHLDKDPQTIKDWNSGKIPVLVAHPQSAGHGLSLQDGGNILVFFSHNWNLEDRLQILERIGPVRQLQSGYDRPVFIYNIIARDTADEMVIERVGTKKEVQDVLLEAMKRKRRK